MEVELLDKNSSRSNLNRGRTNTEESRLSRYSWLFMYFSREERSLTFPFVFCLKVGLPKFFAYEVQRINWQNFAFMLEMKIYWILFNNFDVLMINATQRCIKYSPLLSNSTVGNICYYTIKTIDDWDWDWGIIGFIIPIPIFASFAGAAEAILNWGGTYFIKILKNHFPAKFYW